VLPARLTKEIATKIQDLTVSREIDMSAVHGGTRIAEGGDSGIDLDKDLNYNAYVNDVLMSAAEQGPYALIAAASHITL